MGKSVAIKANAMKWLRAWILYIELQADSELLNALGAFWVVFADRLEFFGRKRFEEHIQARIPVLALAHKD